MGDAKCALINLTPALSFMKTHLKPKHTGISAGMHEPASTFMVKKPRYMIGFNGKKLD